MDVLGDLVKASLGARPIVCQEQVLLDLERARMAKEDTMAAERKMKREEEAKDQAIRRINQVMQNVSQAAQIEGGNSRQSFALHRASLDLTWVTAGMEGGLRPWPQLLEPTEEEADVEPEVQGRPWDPFPRPWISEVAGDGDAADDDSSLEELDVEPS
jgi:hypothetical protein